MAASDASDFVIVGAGVYGLGVARELARRGGDVLVLEAGEVASGASGGVGWRGVRADGRSSAELPVMKLAHERWPGFAEELGVPDLYSRVGHLDLIERPADFDAARERVALQVGCGISSRLIEQGELMELEPGLSRRILGAVHVPDDAIADHAGITGALARSAARHGARLREHARLTRLELEGTKARAVFTEGGERIAVRRALVLCTNANTNALAASVLEGGLPLFDVLPQAIVTAPSTPKLAQHLVGHFSRRLHLKVLGDLRVMVTGGWLGSFDETLGRGQTIPAIVDANFAEAVAVFPALAGTAIELAVADRPESVTPDSLPIIDFLRADSNVFAAVGWSGQGFAPAPIYVKLIADHLLDRVKPVLLEPFRVDRARLAGKPL